MSRLPVLSVGVSMCESLAPSDIPGFLALMSTITGTVIMRGSAGFSGSLGRLGSLVGEVGSDSTSQTRAVPMYLGFFSPPPQATVLPSAESAEKKIPATWLYPLIGAQWVARALPVASSH